MQDAPVTRDREGELERLYREQGARLWRALLAFAGDPDVASDALAEAFAQALRRGAGIRDVERWVWRAAFAIARGELKERSRMVSEPPPDIQYEMEQPANELIAALAKLSPKQRAAVVLHHAAGYRLREVAAIVGSTTGAVKVHLARGRSRLRELLDEEELPESERLEGEG